MAIPTGAGDSQGASDSTATPPVETNNQEADLPNDAEDQADDQADNNGEEGSDKPDEAEGGEESEDLPFHNHPRWKQLIQERRQLREENAKLKERGAADNAKPQQQDQTRRGVDTSSISKMFEGISNHKFKAASEYKDVNELYGDFRNAVVADLMGLRSKQEESNEQMVKQFDSQIEAIRKDLGDEKSYNAFIEFATKTLTKVPATPLEVIFDFFVESYTPTKSGAPAAKPQKPESKVNTKVTPTSNSKSVPSSSYLRNRTMQEIMDEQLRKK